LGVLGCNAALDVPAEESLVAVEGRVASSKVTTGKGGSVSGVELQLAGRPETWRYRASYPNFREAQPRLVPGALVRFWVSPDARPSRWRPDFWRLEVSGSPVLTFQSMKSHSRRLGKSSGWVGIVGALAAALLGWKYGSFLAEELSYPTVYRYPGRRTSGERPRT
jgi:hypothetical protein